MCVVSFWANPLIDGKDGWSVVELEFAFTKANAQMIIEKWGGIANYNRFIITDYIYAIAYVLFLRALLRYLMQKKERLYKTPLYLAPLAGLLDWIENSMQLLFINYNFTNAFVFAHSLIASLKFLLLSVVLGYIVVLQRTEPKKNLH